MTVWWWHGSLICLFNPKNFQDNPLKFEFVSDFYHNFFSMTNCVYGGDNRALHWAMDVGY